MPPIDPAKVPASPEIDAAMAEWMGWKPFLNMDEAVIGWHDSEGNYYSAIAGSASTWSPSTNPAHAGEARRKASGWKLEFYGDSVEAVVYLDETERWYRAEVMLTETNGNIGEAEALAITRACLEAKARALIYKRHHRPSLSQNLLEKRR